MKTITVNLDKERHLKLTLGGMFAYEQTTGKSLWNITSLQDFTDAEITNLLWACCLWEDRDLKRDEFIFALNPGQFPEIVNAVLECLNIAFGKGGDGEKSPLAVNSRNGSKSGLLPGIISIFKKGNSGN